MLSLLLSACAERQSTVLSVFTTEGDGSYAKSYLELAEDTSRGSGSKYESDTQSAGAGNTFATENPWDIVLSAEVTQGESYPVENYADAPAPLWKWVTKAKAGHDKKPHDYTFITLPAKVLRMGQQSGWGVTSRLIGGNRPPLDIQAFQAVITVSEGDVKPTESNKTGEQSVRLTEGKVPYVGKLAKNSVDFNRRRNAVSQSFPGDGWDIDSIWLNTAPFTDTLDKFAKTLNLPKDGTAYLKNAIRTHMVNDTNVWDEFLGWQVRFVSHCQAHRQRKLERKGNKNMKNKKADKRKRE